MMSRRIKIALLLSLLPGSLLADWPQWRGPDRSGVTNDGFVTGPVDLELLWRRDLGSGYASVSLADGRAVTTATFESGDWVVAFNEQTGEELWRYRLGDVFLGRSGSDDGPIATPAVANNTVVVLEPEGLLVALSLEDGRKLWSRQLVEQNGARVDVYGLSTAPLIEGERVIVQLGAESGLITALNLKDGSVLWTAGASRATYQNPTVLEVAGVQQVITQSNNTVEAFDLESGRALWSLAIEQDSQSGDVVPLGEDRVLVTRWSQSKALQIGRSGDQFSVEELWTSDDLARTYGVPVRVEEHLYGFKSGFLTCVSIATGERVWRSRPPGGRGLIAAGGNLYINSPDGSLTVVDGAVAGYKEVGQIQVFEEQRNFTPPSASDGVIFVRNLEQIAAIRVSAGSVSNAQSASATEPKAGTVLAELAGQVQSSGGEQAVARFLERFPLSPILDGEDVHFVFHGQVEDLAIQGDMTGFFNGEPMHRLEGTDLYYRSFDLPEGDRWEYSFAEFDRTFADPRNPTHVGSEDSERSVVTFVGWQDLPVADIATGRLEERILPGEPELKLSLHLPAGYDEGNESLPLAVWFDGEAALADGRIQDALDLQASKGRPVVGVFLQFPQRLFWSAGREDFESALHKRALPFIEGEYRVQRKSESRLLVAQEWAVEVALTTALRADFGGAAIQSPLIDPKAAERLVLPAAEEVEQPFELWLDYGEFDFDFRSIGLSAASSSAQLSSGFESLGHRVRVHRTPGGGNWTRWRGATPELLDHFFGDDK